MAYFALDGAFTANPHPVYYLLLSCPTVADILVLCEYIGDQPYEQYEQGHKQSDNRSILGALRQKQGHYAPKDKWDLNYLVSGPQLNLFHALLEAQRTGQIIQMTDAWGAAPTIRSVWVDVADRYVGRVAPGWHGLQFSALEV